MKPTQITASALVLGELTKSANIDSNTHYGPESSRGAILSLLLPYLLGSGLGAGIGYAKQSEGDVAKNRSGFDRALRGGMMGTGVVAGGRLGGLVGSLMGAGAGGLAGGLTGAGVGGLSGDAGLGAATGGGLGMLAGAGTGAIGGMGLGGYGGYKLMRKILGE